MNKVYVHTKTTHKEQPAICLWHMSSGSNGCRRQPIPRFMKEEGKFIAETRQHMEEQFIALDEVYVHTKTARGGAICRHERGVRAYEDST
jgi:hypothetical protein